VECCGEALETKETASVDRLHGNVLKNRLATTEELVRSGSDAIAFRL